MEASGNQRLAIVPTLAQGAWEKLQSYNWPGNVRELENLVERELILRHEDALRFDELPGDKGPPSHPTGASNTGIHSLDEAMAQHIQQALAMANGKIQGVGGAAELLSINPNTLRKRMRKLGVDFGRKAKREFNIEQSSGGREKIIPQQTNQLDDYKRSGATHKGLPNNTCQLC
ncbi:MAG: helix-turn-helix domain-containing protein [Desulfocapsaceae bacterium]